MATTTVPTLLRSKSEETKKRMIPPKVLRSSSSPTTLDEILDRKYICFKGGEQITFILTHRSWLTHGIHLGIKVVQDGKEFTLGFSPSVSGTGLLKPVDAAIFIPDIKVETALKTGTANILNNTPFLLSKTAAARLNDYTCNGTPGVKETFEMARLNPKDRAEWGEEILFTKKFVPKNIKYKFAFNDDTCTNCQGFLSTIFSDDDDVLKTIIPYLQTWASTEVAEKARIQQATKPSKTTYLDHFEKNTYLGLGGYKKSRKPKKKHRRRRKKTRKKRGGSPLPPVPYNELKLSNPMHVRSSGDWIYDMKNKKNNEVHKVRITDKVIDPQDGDKMIKFQRVYQVLDGVFAPISGRFEGYTPYHDHTGPWTYITPYDDVILTKHISPAKTLKLAASGIFGGRRTRKRKRKGKKTKRKRVKRHKKTKRR